MHVQFELTREDVIDANRRCLARSEAVESWRLKGLLYTVVISWLFTFLLFTVLQLIVAGAVLGLVAAVISGFIYPSSHRSRLEGRLRELYRESFGDMESFPCEVEVAPVGVWVRQMNTQVTQEWEGVRGVEEVGGCIDILTHAGGFVVVPDRAFSTEGERRKFIELVQGYIELAGAEATDPNAQLTRG